MLYKKLYAISLSVYAFLTSRTMGGEYFVSSNSGNPYTCNDTDRCDIYCDEENKVNGYQFNCGNASECYFHCEEKKCAEVATIRAINSDNLYVDVGKNGQECFKGANIYTPNNGNASFTTSAKKGFKEMNVHSGNNTQSIIIDSSQGQEEKDDCKDMNIYASTADYLKIIIGDGQEFELSTVECPVDSTYNAPDIAPCIIDGANAIMTDLNIIAPDGVPHGVYIIGSTATNVHITCSNIDNKNGADGDISTFPFDTGSDCWWTNNPTNDPTTNPTNKPTPSPTTDPTPSPTEHPTDSTKNPTPSPTSNPTPSPTYNPTPPPTTQPTSSPVSYATNDPTYTPTDGPTNAPISAGITSSNPSVFPTTGNPTANPSYTPTTSTSTVPPTTSIPSTNANTSIPTIIPSNKPTDRPSFHPTKSPKYWVCNENCKSTEIYIKASYWFSDTIRYNLQNMDCFLYKIFANYSFSIKFDVCDIEIAGIYGGVKYNDETYCQFKPCLFNSDTNSRRRLSENNDGNLTMNITGIDNNTYTVINKLSLDAMEHEFENDLLENFGVILDVTILVETFKVDEEDSNELQTSNDTLWDSLSRLNKLWYVVIVLIFLLCCIGCGMVWYIKRAHEASKQLSSKLKHAMDKKMSELKHRGWTPASPHLPPTVPSTSQTNLQTYTIPIRPGTAVNPSPNDTKNTAENVHRSLSMNRDQLEMVTHNQLYTDGKKRKRKHESKSTHDFDDEPTPTLSSSDDSNTNNTDPVDDYDNDDNNNNDNNNNDNDNDHVPGQWNYFKNLGSVSWEQQQQHLQQMIVWQQQQMHSNNNNANYNTYNNALNMYNQEVVQGMNYQHGPHQSMGINSILPNTVYNLTNQYNNNNNNNAPSQRRKNSYPDEENGSTSTSASTTTSTESGDDDDDDDSNDEHDTDNDNNDNNDTIKCQQIV